MTDFWCDFIWNCTSDTQAANAAPEISALPLLMAICVLFIFYAVITDRKIK